MATWLYKDEDKQLVEAKRVAAMLNAGWSVNYEGCKTCESEEAADEEEVLQERIEQLRSEAKEKKIKGWHKMSAQTLMEKLGYVS